MSGRSRGERQNDVPTRMQWGWIVLVAVAYALVAKLTSLTASLPGGAAPIFPSAGLALAAALVLGRQALLGIWLGSFGANAIIYAGSPAGLLRQGPGGIVVLGSIAAGAALGAWVGAWLGRRVAGNSDWFASARSALSLCIVASLGAATVSSVVGVLTLVAAAIIPSRSLPDSWLTWFLGDCFGCVIATPFMLGWRGFHAGSFRLRRWGEALAIGCLLLLLGYVAFFRGWRVEYGVLPLLIWAAFRFGVPGTATASALVAVLATIGTIAGSSPFSRATVNDSLLALHGFLGVTVIAALLLASLLVERKRANKELLNSEEKARVSNERLRQATRVAGIGIFEDDHHNGVIYWSPEQRAFYGFDKTEEVTLAKILAPIAPDDRERIASHVRQAHDPMGNGLFEVEHSISCLDGKTRWIATRSQTFFEGEGPARHAVRTIGASIDMTSRRLAERERERLEAQLRQSQRLEAIGTLAGGIAHDFNNILAAILGNAELLRIETKERGEVSPLLTDICTATERARQLVSRILTLSRKAESRPVTCELAPIVDEALNLLRAALPSSVAIQRNLAAGSAVIDPTQFHQVVMNLATNASHAMERDGGVLAVRLETVLLEGGDAVREHLEPGAYVELAVSDNGTGIPPEVLDRIFEPYFTTKEAGKGTGLGLSVAHGIVTAAGGAIRVESEPNCGTTFRVFLPLTASASRTSVVEQTPIPRGTERVLVVDDESMIVAMTAKCLEALGYSVTTAHRADKALEIFRANPERFDVVITDLTMPRMGGEALVDHLLTARPNLPVIVATGHSEDAIVQRLLARGVRAVLAKPVSLATLARAIRDCIERRPAPISSTIASLNR